MSNPEPVLVFASSAVQAHQKALAERQPIFVPAAIYADDRGWSIMNQLSGVLRPEGQINFTMQYPNVVKAWHRHQRQVDFWLCVLGHIKVGVHREEDGRSWMMVTGEKRPGVIIIPPTLWHGTTAVGLQPAGLLYYVTHAYDPANPDEQRQAFDSIPAFPWETQNR